MNTIMTCGPDDEKEKKALVYAKRGLLFGLFSGILWSVDGLFLGRGLALPPCNSPAVWLLAPLLAAGLHDSIEGSLCFLYNCATGRRKEVVRTVCARPGRLCAVAALIGAPFGMGGYMLSLSLVGPAYALPLTSLYPGIASLLALIFLKERISLRAWLGLVLCVAGAAVISYSPPESTSSALFYLGIAFALLAAAGWAVEGVCIASAVDFVEPSIAMNINKITSALLYLFVIVPGLALFVTQTAAGFSLWQMLKELASGPTLFFFFLAGSCGCVTYLALYNAYNAVGVSRGMALNITYALWGVVLGACFTDIPVTPNLIFGAGVIVAGMVFVIGNPKDLLTLRNVS